VIPNAVDAGGTYRDGTWIITLVAYSPNTSCAIIGSHLRGCNNVTEEMFWLQGVQLQGGHVMPNDLDQSLAVSFRRNDGHREQIPLKDCTIAEAVSAVERIFSISEGLYTEAEIYRGDELVEKIMDPTSSRMASILLQLRRLESTLERLFLH
jgi:hypothetical protein